jgi:hypothetical protein
MKPSERCSANSIDATVASTDNIIYAASPLHLWGKRLIFAVPIGEAGQICSTNKKFSWIFLYSLHFAYRRSISHRTNSIGAAQGKQKNRRSAGNYSQCFAYCPINCLLILLYWPGMEICLIRDDGELKFQNNAQCHSPRPIPNDWCCFGPTIVFPGYYL